MKILTILSVDTERNMVEVQRGSFASYSHFCSIANKPPQKGDQYRYAGSTEMGESLVTAVFINPEKTHGH